MTEEKKENLNHSNYDLGLPIPQPEQKKEDGLFTASMLKDPEFYYTIFRVVFIIAAFLLVFAWTRYATIEEVKFLHFLQNSGEWNVTLIPEEGKVIIRPIDRNINIEAFNLEYEERYFRNSSQP